MLRQMSGWIAVVAFGFAARALAMDEHHHGHGGHSEPAQAPVAKPEVPAGAILVNVTGPGFEPARIEVKKGKKVQLAFFRADGRNCADKVVFPDLKIERDLPVGKTVVVEFVPKKVGEVAFACGMNMLKGSVVVVGG